MRKTIIFALALLVAGTARGLVWRQITGTVKDLQGTAVVSGSVSFQVIGQLPADATAGIIAPRTTACTIISGSLGTCSLAAPATYLVTLISGTTEPWAFQCLLAEAGGVATSVQAMYLSTTRLPVVRPNALVEGDSINLTSGVLDGDRLPSLSATKKGGVPSTGTPSGKYLKDDGSWATVSGGGSVPTGSGFRHVTSGSEDGASKLVENADLSGLVGLGHGALNTDLSCCGAIGDLLYADTSTTFARRVGPTANSLYALTSQGNGSVAAPPAWTLVSSLGFAPTASPTFTGTATIANGDSFTLGLSAASGMGWYISGGGYWVYGTKYSVKTVILTDGTIRVNPGISLSWASQGSPEDYAADTAIIRSSAGVLKITNGSTGYGALDSSGYSASGTPGLTTIVTVRDSGGSADCTMTFAGGILTATTCSHT